MLNKNYMAGNVHLSSEVAEPFDIRLKKEKPWRRVLISFHRARIKPAAV